MRISFAAAAGLLLTAMLAAPYAFAAMLSDIADIPEQTAIGYLQKQGIISGYPDGTFKPKKTVNRAELLKILVAREGANPAPEEYHHCFPDVTNEWFATYVCYAKQRGWVNGYPDGTFRPADTVNAAEAIKMIMIAIGFQPNQSSAASSIVGIEPGAWYAPYAEAALQHRILPSTDLDPGADIFRASVAAMVYRSLTEGAGRGDEERKNSLLGRLRSGGGNRTDESDIHIPVITFADITKTYGDASFTLSALSSSLGHITYASNNPSVATINGTTVTIVGAGTTTITATQAANGRFEAGSTTATLTVNGVLPLITFSNLTKSHIDANFTLSPVSESPGAFTFTSGNSSLVSVSGNTADIVGTNGTVTITAEQAASGNYAAARKTMTITIFATYCISEPCLNGGTCVPTLGGNGSDNFLCTCVDDHYAGVYCEESDMNCQENGGDIICYNGGTCVKNIDGGECNCINNFCGTYCTILPSQCG